MSNEKYCLTNSNYGFTVTYIKDNQFLVECNCKSAKIIGENEYSITHIILKNGPSLTMGKDFLGMGIISGLEIIETEPDNTFMIKVLTKNESS